MYIGDFLDSLLEDKDFILGYIINQKTEEIYILTTSQDLKEKEEDFMELNKTLMDNGIDAIYLIRSKNKKGFIIEED